MNDLPIAENAYRDFLAKEGTLHRMLQEAKDAYMDSEHGGVSIPEQVALPGAMPWSLWVACGALLKHVGTINPEAWDSSEEAGRKALGSGTLGGKAVPLVKEVWETYGDEVPGDSFWLRHLCWGAYARTRHTYHIAPELWEELRTMEWPEGMPAEAFKYLPLPGFALREPDGRILLVCYDLLSGKEDTGQLELRVGLLNKDRSIDGYSAEAPARNGR